MRGILKFIVVFVLILLVPATIVNASAERQDGGNSSVLYLPIIMDQHIEITWLGPFGGRAVCLAVDPTNPLIVYAGSWGAGVFKSIDGGATWVRSSVGLANGWINSLTIDPTSPQTLYAGTYKDGIYKTIDGGQTWFHSNAGVEDLSIVYAITIDPTTPQTVYIGTRSGRPEITNRPWYGKIYRSLDGGANWTMLPGTDNFGGTGVKDWVYSIAVNPTSPNIILAAGHESGPVRSTDGGQTWQPALSGIQNCLVPTERGCHSRSIVYDMRAGQEFQHSAFLGYANGYGVYKTSDDGATWIHIYSGINLPDFFRLAIDPINPTTLYAAAMSDTYTTIGVKKSINSGINWSDAGLTSKSIYDVKVDPISSSNLFAGTIGWGIWKSANSGSTWSESNTGFINTSVSSTVVNPANTSMIFAAMNDNGVALSQDGGASWQDCSNNLGDRGIHAMSMPRNNVYYVLTDQSGVYSMNMSSGPCYWRPATVITTATLTDQPAFNPSHPFADRETLLGEDRARSSSAIESMIEAQRPVLSMAWRQSTTLMYIGTSAGTSSPSVYITTDGGGRWDPRGLAGYTVWSLVLHPTNNNSLYAATNVAGAVKYTTNGGFNWADISLPGLTAYTVIFSPSDANIVYAGTNSGIYKRVGTGDFTYLGLGGLNVTAIAERTASHQVLLAGTTDGLQISYNGGLNWEYGPVELDGITVQSITEDPINNKLFYIGTLNHGILRVRFN